MSTLVNDFWASSPQIHKGAVPIIGAGFSAVMLANGISAVNDWEVSANGGWATKSHAPCDLAGEIGILAYGLTLAASTTMGVEFSYDGVTWWRPGKDVPTTGAWAAPMIAVGAGAPCGFGANSGVIFGSYGTTYNGHRVSPVPGATYARIWVNTIPTAIDSDKGLSLVMR